MKTITPPFPIIVYRLSSYGVPPYNSRVVRCHSCQREAVLLGSPHAVAPIPHARQRVICTGCVKIDTRRFAKVEYLSAGKRSSIYFGTGVVEQDDQNVHAIFGVFEREPKYLQSRIVSASIVLRKPGGDVVVTQYEVPSRQPVENSRGTVLTSR